MYVAKKKFNSYFQGEIKKGQTVIFNQAWLDADMIEEKPEPRAGIETKPQIEPTMSVK